MVLFKSFWLFCLALGAAVHLDLAIDICRGDNGLVTDACTGEEDVAAHFMQLSGRPMRLSLAGSSKVQHQQEEKLTVIKPLSCTQYAQPMQVQFQDGIGYVVTQLNVETGNHSTMFTIPRTAVPGNYSDLNACGVSPHDSIIYCAMSAQGSWIVRIDDSRVEFVIRLPSKNWNTADFSPSGAFFIADSDAEFLVLTELHTKRGFANKTDPGLLDLRQKKLTSPPGWNSSADVVVSFADLNSKGTKEYMFSLYGPHLHIAQYNLTAGNFSGSWKLNVRPHRWDNIFGAGWNFQGKLFFASNRGAGVYQIPLEKIVLADGAWVSLTWIGLSAGAVKNDGFNCLASPNPWITAMPAFDCSAHYNPIQLLMRESQGVYDVSQLLPDGNSQSIFTVPLNQSGEGDSYTVALNGIGIGPKDNIMYGIILLAGWKHSASSGSHRVAQWPQWLVRFDGKKYEYVASLKSAKQPVSGTFDMSGNYYYIGDNILYKISRPDRMKGYANWTAPQLPMFDYNSGVQLSGIYQMEDIVTLPANFDGMGDATWIASVSMPAGKLVLIKPSSSPDENIINGYEELSGDCFGNNVSIFTNTSGTECAAACTADDRCRGFAFSQVSLECATKDLDCERIVSGKWKFYQKVVEKRSAKVYTLDIDDVFFSENSSLKQAFGAGWYFNESLFFASNEGAGVFRVPTEEISFPASEYKEIYLHKLSNSLSVADTDGMSCLASNDKAGLNRLWYGADLQSM